jgi:hypothetical protein
MSDIGPPEAAPYPEKFVDPETGKLNVDSLLKSYRALERKLGGASSPDSAPESAPDVNAPFDRQAALKALGVPDTPEQYRVEILDEFLERDPELEAVLHQAGFTGEQVQLVYDLAAEKLAPLMAEVAQAARGATDSARLEAHFGGRQRWAETRRQIKKWGTRHLPGDAFDALCCSYDGVLAIHRMMSAGEEPGLTAGESTNGSLSEAELKRLMRDPRYWRDHDPALTRRIESGFRHLYPSAG